MNKNRDNHFEELCLEAIDANGVFADMAPLMFQTKIIALNAEIASARVGKKGLPFGMVVKELGMMGESLSKLVDEVDEIDNVLANNIAKGINAKRRMEIYQKSTSSLRRANKEETLTNFSQWLAPLTPGTGKSWSTLLQSMAKGSIERGFMENVITNRKVILITLVTLSKMSREVEKLIETLSLVAGRKSHFIAIIATVEAANLGEIGKELVHVAENISNLAKKIDVVGQAATERIADLLALEQRVFLPIKSEINLNIGVADD